MARPSRNEQLMAADELPACDDQVVHIDAVLAARRELPGTDDLTGMAGLFGALSDPTRLMIVAALAANLGIATAKFVAFAFTASSSMLAEGIHSVADSGNQGLLLLGGHRARRKADEDRAFCCSRTYVQRLRKARKSLGSSRKRAWLWSACCCLSAGRSRSASARPRSAVPP